MRRNRSGALSHLRWILLPLAAVAVLLWFTTAVDSLNSGRSEEDLRQLEETLRRSCVACYAAEGVYPPTVDYLQEHYGVQIDQDRYTVRYSVFAENRMPDITVLENEP